LVCSSRQLGSFRQLALDVRTNLVYVSRKNRKVGAAERTAVRGGQLDFIEDPTAAGILNAGTLNLTDSIVMHNLARVVAGGIFNSGSAVVIRSSIIDNGGLGIGGFQNTGTAIIQDSTISSNGGTIGGGILNEGIMTITNSTVANNAANPFGSGGGIANGGTLKITNSTISGNVATTFSRGGGIASGGGLEMQNTILALNILSPFAMFGPDCSGTITSLGNNLIGDLSGCDINLLPTDLIGDPGLRAFMDNGTPGNGHFPLLPTSQAIDAGNNDVCPKRDQLGRRRVGPCDIGAIRFLDGVDRKHKEQDDHQDTAEAFR
jgi:hypothetical protein